jgi:hypothetical protein
MVSNWGMGIALLHIGYRRYRMGHYYKFVKFEFNDLSLYTKNDSNRKRSISLYITVIFLSVIST